MLVGVAFRAIAYADRRPLWMDELMLATSIAWRSFAGLTRPLEYAQTAPLGFLWGAHLMTRVAGVNEPALRALPLAAGVAVLVLVWGGTRRLCGEGEALVALLLATFSYPLVYYSAEAKQYAVEACATAAIVYVTAGVLRAPERGRSWAWLAAAGLVAVFFSQTSVFVLPAAALALCLSPSVRQRPRWLVRVALPAVAWGALFVVLFATVYRATASSSYMHTVWSATFLTPRAPDLGDRLVAAGRAAFLHGV